MIKQRLYEIIEVAEEGDFLSKIYDVVMMVVIVISVLPLTTHSSSAIFQAIDKVTVTVFILDYLLRLFTSNIKLQKGWVSYIRYPFTFMAMIDLISILPSIVMMNSSFKLLRMFRLFRTFRVFKVIRYSKNIQIIKNVFIKQKDSLLVVCWLAIGYVLVSAMVMFNVEPETFPTFFDAIYWATVSLTTVGYGDIYAVTAVGKMITMFSAVFGIAIVALPAGIVTAGYIEEIKDQKKEI